MKNPSTQEAIAFFAQYRKDIEKNGNEAEAGRAAATTQQAIMTQASQHQNTPPVELNDVPTYIPVDRTQGTPSFRLQKLQCSPKNYSPSLLGTRRCLLPSPALSMQRRVTLVLDVDETLVHSSYTKKPGVRYDKEIPITHEGSEFHICVKYRPYLMDFLDFVSTRFEVVIFTASLSVYCNALMDTLDPENKLGSLRLFREHCTVRGKSYIKDLYHLNRDLSRVAIIDNSPTAYLFQQRNAIPILSFFDDEHDEELVKLYTLLGRLARCDSVFDVLDPYNANGVVP